MIDVALTPRRRQYGPGPLTRAEVQKELSSRDLEVQKLRTELKQAKEKLDKVEQDVKDLKEPKP